MSFRSIGNVSGSVMRFLCDFLFYFFSWEPLPCKFLLDFLDLLWFGGFREEVDNTDDASERPGSFVLNFCLMLDLFLKFGLFQL